MPGYQQGPQPAYPGGPDSLPHNVIQGEPQAFGENDLTWPGQPPPASAAGEIEKQAAVQAAVVAKPLRRNDVLVSVLLYLVGVAVAFAWAYDLFSKLFDLVHNRCSAKKDFTVECVVIRPPSSALWGLLIGGGGMFLALVTALVLAAVAGMTGRRAWLWPAVALPVIVLAGGAGHVLVATAIK